MEITRRSLFGLAGGTTMLTACSTFGDSSLEPYHQNVQFNHGVASGDPLHDRVILWTRVTPVQETSEPIAVECKVFNDKGKKIVAQFQTETSKNSDYCVKIDATGLEPNTEYQYRFEVVTPEGKKKSAIGRTKTTAISGHEKVKLAAVSCSNWQFGYFNVYNLLGKMADLDAIVHLGDYLYEYGVDGYGSEVAQALGRFHDPEREIVSLADYRLRHAQYKSDPDLQSAHAIAPWICTWDDHESANNSYRTGAENHQPNDGEGSWTDRKQVAIQAYLEWMPVRDPRDGQMRESIYRKFKFGDVATVFALESRLTGRSDEISWADELSKVGIDQDPRPVVGQVLRRVSNPTRTMLGIAQEKWLAKGMEASVKEGVSWQVLANQVVMAKVRPPDFTKTLTQFQMEMQTIPLIKRLIPFSALGLPFNLDAWDGFPAARERLYQSAKNANARLVTLTGDTHTAWVNSLVDDSNTRLGVEFGCTSVSSPGLGAYMGDIPDLGKQFEDANEQVYYHDPFGSGATIVTLEKDSVTSEFMKVTTAMSTEYMIESSARYRAERLDNGVSEPMREM